MVTLQTESITYGADMVGEYLAVHTPRTKELLQQFEQGKKYTVEIKEYSEKRSKTANSFMWACLSACAGKLGTTKEELYIGYIRKIGPYKDFKLSEDEAKTFRVAWQNLGTGWPTEQVDFTPDGDVVIRAYYGSSTYTKKRMSRLIDMVVEDAKEIGVDCMTEKERSLLIDKWTPVEVK